MHNEMWTTQKPIGDEQEEAGDCGIDGINSSNKQAIYGEKGRHGI